MQCPLPFVVRRHLVLSALNLSIMDALAIFDDRDHDQVLLDIRVRTFNAD